MNTTRKRNCFVFAQQIQTIFIKLERVTSRENAVEQEHAHPENEIVSQRELHIIIRTWLLS